MDDETTKTHGGCPPASDWVLVGNDASQEREQTTADLILQMDNAFQSQFNGILGSSESALDRDPMGDQRIALTVLHQRAKEVQSMFHDLQLCRKIEANTLVPASVPFSLSDATVDALVVLTAADGKGREFAYEVGSTVPDGVIGDWSYLQRILVKLLRIIVKVSHDGKIKLAVSTSDEEEDKAPNRCVVQFVFSYIQNHSTGDKTLDPIRDIDRKPNQRTGIFPDRHQLSLLTVRRLVGLMGGDVWTQGGLERTTLHVRLPFELDDQNVSTQLQWALGKSSPYEGILLLDEGSAGFRDGVIRHLEQRNAEHSVVNVNCSDVVLPPEVQNGGRAVFRRAVVESTRAARKLREYEEFKDIPVLVVGPELSVDLSFLTKNGTAISTMQDTPELRRLNILIAEDNAVNQKVVRKLLQRENHTLHIVNNGLEALEQAKERRFDIILMDQCMPVMDGIAATARIREWESEKSILRTPIIGMVAFQSCSPNLDDLVHKPIRYNALVETIRRNARRFT